MIDATGEEEEEEGDGEGEKRDERGHHLSQKGSRLTNEEIVAHAVTFLLAGYETTANTLSFTSYLLAINPHIQERLQSEIDSYFDDKPVNEIGFIILCNSLMLVISTLLSFRMHHSMKQVKRSHT